MVTGLVASGFLVVFWQNEFVVDALMLNQMFHGFNVFSFTIVWSVCFWVFFIEKLLKNICSEIALAFG